MRRLRSLIPATEILRTSAGTTGVLVARLLTLAATLILLTRAFGASHYGAYASAASIAFMMGIIPGIGAGYVLLSRIESDQDSPADVWSYSWPIICGFGLALVPAFILIAMVSAGAAHLSVGQLTALGLSELVATPWTVTLSFIIQARGRVTLSQVVQWLPFAFRVAAAAAAMAVAPDDRISAFLWLQLISSLAAAWIALTVARRLAPLHWRPRWVHGHELRRGASFGLMNLVALNPAELDKVLTLRLLGAFDAGIYATAARVVGAMVTPVTALLLSVQVRLFGRSPDGASGRRWMVIQVACAAAAWGALSLLILEVASPWVPMLFGKGFESLAQLMPWLAVAAPFIALRVSAGTVLVSLGRPFQRIAFELAGIALLCVAMVALTSAYGLRGAAFALTLAEAAMTLLGWVMIFRLATPGRRQRGA